MQHRRPALAATALTLALAGCSGAGSLPQAPGAPGAPAGPKVQVQQSAAPSTTAGHFATRVNQVTRTGDTATVSITAANARGLSIIQHGMSIRTNTGITVPPTFAERTTDAGQAATFSLVVPIPDKNAKSLAIKVDADQGAPLEVPLPTDDVTLLWPEAPLRQVGLAPQVQRTGGVDLVVDAVRSRGLYTEVDYHASAVAANARVAICSFNFQDDKCSITESNGRVHRLAQRTATDRPLGIRTRGTLVFLGELDPSATDLTLALSIDTNTDIPPVRVTLPTHADSPSVAAAGSLARPPFEIQPITLNSPETGAKVTINRVDVLDDQIQLTFHAEGGTKNFLIQGDRLASSLVEPNGSIHRATDARSAGLTVEPGKTLDGILTFRGATPADITTLTLTLGEAYTHPPVTTTLTIPSVDPAPPAPPATLGQLDDKKAPAPTPPATPGSLPTPSPSATKAPTAIIDMFDMHPIPPTQDYGLGGLASSITGLTVGGNSATSETVDPAREAEAQRSLRDLGAQRTPDGWVLNLPETVLFDYNKSDLKPEASAKIEQVAKLLAYYDKAKIRVQGHTDADGDDKANQDLSQRRAQAVADGLSGKGVQTARMAVEGFGETQPIAPNSDDANKQKNRRVQIVLNESA